MSDVSTPRLRSRFEGVVADRVGLAAASLWPSSLRFDSEPLGALASRISANRPPSGQAIGGQGGIRTHGTLARTLVFKTSAFNRSATCPQRLAR